MVLVVMPSFANATSIQDLKLDCSAQYQVLVSTPYYHASNGRNGPEAGTRESVQILSLVGSGCARLDADFGIAATVSLQLDYGISTGGDRDQAIQLAKERQGQIFSVSAEQTFKYQTQDGDLPLFPLIHEESVSFLSLSGEANSKVLYGTPLRAELTDQQVMHLLDAVFDQLEWGKVSEEYQWNNEAWLDLAISLTPQSNSSVKEDIQNLLLIFSNTVKYTSSLTTSSTGAKLGMRINELLNSYGGSKFETKLDALEKNPLLFDNQIVDWAFGSSKAPVLDSQGIEGFLEYVLAQVTNLAKVPDVTECRILLAQYKEATQSIQSHGTSYLLSEKSEHLVEQILAF